MTKKVFTFLLLSLFITGTLFAATPGSRLSPGIGDIKGQGTLPSDPHRTFRLIRWMPQVPASGDYDDLSRFDTCTADSIVVWDITSDDGVTITTTTTSYDSAVAGVIVSTILGPLTADGTTGKTAFNSIGNANWGWLQTYGKAEVTIQVDSGTCTAGDALATGSESGSACDFLPSATVSGANGNAGFFYDTGAADATNIEVFLKCE